MLPNTVFPEARGTFLKPDAHLHADSRLDLSGWMLKRVADNFPDLLSVHDAPGTFLCLLGQTESLLGWRSAQLERANFFDFIHPADAPAVQDKWMAALNSGEATAFCCRVRRTNGMYRWIDSHIRICADRECVVMVSRDVQEERERQQQLEHHASHDPLTDVLNRRAWMQVLHAEWMRCARNQQPLSMGLLDVDGFKQVNDRHGHHAGDALLQELSAIVGTHKRAYDTLGRLGGDEFVLLLPQTDLEEAEHVLQRLIECVGRQLPGNSVSCGVSSSSEACTAEELLAQADAAMYRSKRLGGNRVSSWIKER